jgi:hypothetical protein
LLSGSQGLLFPRVSTGKTTDPGRGVGDGICVAVAVGSGVDVDNIGVFVGGIDVERTEQFNEINRSINIRADKPDFFIDLISF